MFRTFPKLMIGIFFAILFLIVRQPVVMMIWVLFTAGLTALECLIPVFSDLSLPPPDSPMTMFLLSVVGIHILNGAFSVLAVMVFSILALLTAIHSKTKSKSITGVELYFYRDYFTPYLKGVFIPLFLYSLIQIPAFIFLSSVQSLEVANYQPTGLYIILYSFIESIIAIMSAAYASTLLVIPNLRRVARLEEGLSLIFSHHGKSIFAMFVVLSALALTACYHFGIERHFSIFCAMGSFLVVPIFVNKK
jgi:hypothetical protein